MDIRIVWQYVAEKIYIKAIWDLYEEIKDREIIEQYEAREKTSKSGFIKIEDILD